MFKKGDVVEWAAEDRSYTGTVVDVDTNEHGTAVVVKFLGLEDERCFADQGGAPPNIDELELVKDADDKSGPESLKKLFTL